MKMLRIFIICILFLIKINASNLEKSIDNLGAEQQLRNFKHLHEDTALLTSETDNKFADVRDFASINRTNEEDSARVGGAATNLINGLCLLFNTNANAGAGPCVVLNQKWALSSSVIVPSDITPAALIIYTKVTNTASGDLLAKTRHRVKEIKKVEYNAQHYSTMHIMRVCVEFPEPYVSLPTPNKSYNIGYSAEFVNYLPNLVGAKKGFANACECDDQNGWDAVRSLCLSANSFIYNGPNEKGSLLFVDGVFAGVNLWPTGTAGEPYTDISKYLQWITSNAAI